MCRQAGAPTPMQKTKLTQETSRCAFQKLYLFVLPLITSLFTVVF